MPISISNSSTRRPTQFWLRTWVFVCALSGFSFIGWEFFNVANSLWRTGTNDSERLWAEKRIEASQLGTAGIVLIGASRIQLGIDTLLLQKMTGQKVIQLAIDGNPYISVLEDLATDESILGTIIVSTTVNGLLNSQNQKNRASQYLNYYHSISTHLFRFDTVEAKLTAILRRYFRSRSNFVTPYKWALWPKDRLAQAGYLKFNSDRSVEANYSLVDVGKMYSDRVKRHLGEESEAVYRSIPKFEDNIKHVNTLLTKIMSRGGRVVFVRFPTDKQIWEIDDTRYPKKLYWDKFAQLSIARTVHFGDYPSLSGFNLPDGSHLDQSDKKEFTRELSNILFNCGKNYLSIDEDGTPCDLIR